MDGCPANIVLTRTGLKSKQGLGENLLFDPAQEKWLLLGIPALEFWIALRGLPM
jgi:hypothetical protein